MKKIALRDVPSLAQYVPSLGEEPVVLTANGRAVAALVALPNADAETVALSTNPTFLAIIERSRRRHDKEGGISPDQMRRRLGLKRGRRRPGRERARARRLA